jgi:signal peptidase I
MGGSPDETSSASSGEGAGATANEAISVEGAVRVAGKEGRRPSRWLAALLGFVATGLGHVYAGFIWRGLAWAAGVPAFAMAWLLLWERLPARGFLLLALACLFVVPWVAAVVDGVRVASRPSARRSSLAVILGLALVLFASSTVAKLAIRHFVVEAFKIPSGSMAPSLEVGDHLVVDKTRTRPRRGDLIVFRAPEHPEQDYVKRVVGLPGDRVEFTDGFLVLNGIRVPTCKVGSTLRNSSSFELYVEALDERLYLTIYEDPSPVPIAARQGPWIVNENEFFVLGDNRFNAYDSRMWFGGQGGGVPVSNVLGTPFAIWLSTTGRRVDLSRTGMRLDTPQLSGSSAALEPAFRRCLEELRPR